MRGDAVGREVRCPPPPARPSKAKKARAETTLLPGGHRPSAAGFARRRSRRSSASVCTPGPGAGGGRQGRRWRHLPRRGSKRVWLDARMESRGSCSLGLRGSTPSQQQRVDGDTMPMQTGLRWPFGHRHCQCGKLANNVINAASQTCATYSVFNSIRIVLFWQSRIRSVNAVPPACGENRCGFARSGREAASDAVVSGDVDVLRAVRHGHVGEAQLVQLATAMDGRRRGWMGERTEAVRLLMGGGHQKADGRVHMNRRGSVLA